MDDIKYLLKRMAESANAAKAHYQIWFTLRGEGKALPKFRKDINDFRYVDFFHASNSGHYKLIFIELGCLFDSDGRAASFKNLKEALKHTEKINLIQKIESSFSHYKNTVSKVKTIRSRLIAHKDLNAEIKKTYKEKNGITPDQIRDLIETSCVLINELNQEIIGKGNNPIANESNRYENATFSLLEVLKKGRS